MQVIAVFPPGLEEEGVKELVGLGAKSVRSLRRSAAFEADMACLYRIYIQARLPFRLLREIAHFHCDGPKSLYLGVQNAIDWESWLHPSKSFRVDVSGTCNGLTHTHFTALQVKNAIVDFQRSLWGARSYINLENPDICFHLHLSSLGAVLSLDGSGVSLHRRGYRAAMGVAPLKENLAAGLIRLTGWNASVPLVDPLCGSGTFLIEAASMALGFAPGFGRAFLLKGWADFHPIAWNMEKEKALRQVNLDKQLPLIIGFEKDEQIANQAKDNIAVAQLGNFVHIKTGHFHEFELPQQQGLIVCNPPYGKRVGDEKELEKLYSELGSYLKKYGSGWQLWLLSGNAFLSRALKMKATRKIPVSNGGIDCRWLNYSIR